MADVLARFYAVAGNSMYEVTCASPGVAALHEIAKQGYADFPRGRDLSQGRMVAITHVLQVYWPEKHSFRSLKKVQSEYERRIERVHPAHMGMRTSLVVGLFLTEEAAMECLKAENRRFRDVRWFADTKAVVDSIGENHSAFYVSTVTMNKLLP